MKNTLIKNNIYNLNKYASFQKVDLMIFIGFLNIKNIIYLKIIFVYC